MAVLLMLMFRSRGVLLPQQIAPVYAFGAPALFCDGALGGWNACSDDSDASEACSLVSTVACSQLETLLAEMQCNLHRAVAAVPSLHNEGV